MLGVWIKYRLTGMVSPIKYDSKRFSNEFSFSRGSFKGKKLGQDHFGDKDAFKEVQQQLSFLASHLTLFQGLLVAKILTR